MDFLRLSKHDIQATRANFTLYVNHDDEHFLRCWKHQTCKGCLAASQCGWCPFVGLHLQTISLQAVHTHRICRHGHVCRILATCRCSHQPTTRTSVHTGLNVGSYGQGRSGARFRQSRVSLPLSPLYRRWPLFCSWSVL